MSQAKVDKRKYEKKHRKEIEKKRKIRIAVKSVVAALILGVIIGVPVGIRIYRQIPKFVGDSTLEAFISTYIDDNYAAEVAGLNAVANETENTESTDPVDAVSDAIEEATGNELQQVTDDNIDDLLGGSDTSEDSESSETSEDE